VIAQYAGRVRSFPATGALLWAGVFAYLMLFAWALANTTYSSWGALLVGPVLAVASFAVVGRVARHDADPRVLRLLQWAILYKFLGTVARYFMVQVVYGGTSDANHYHSFGARVAESYRHFDFVHESGKIVGSGAMEILTGLVYACIGVTRFGGFMFFAWLSFLGLILLYRAFCIACPQGDRRRCALLLFFFPSLAFWPSSIGKEAFMLLALGVTSYGAALLLTHRRGGMPILFLGLAGTAIVRPHLTLIAFLALMGAYIIRRPARPSLLGPLAKGIGILTLLVGGLLVVSRVESFFAIDAFDTSSVSQALEETTEQTSRETDGSQFEAATPNTPADYPMAFVTVLFRPFPWEAHNSQAIVASFESMLLVVILIRSWKRIAGVPRIVARLPYLAYSLGFVLLFSFAFASVANFGILARQRVQVLPFVIALAAAPVILRPARVRRSPQRAEPPVYWALSGGPGRPPQRAHEPAQPA
jgi:hypothetical protein